MKKEKPQSVNLPTTKGDHKPKRYEHGVILGVSEVTFGEIVIKKPVANGGTDIKTS
jgi:hypothetical protein